MVGSDWMLQFIINHHARTLCTRSSNKHHHSSTSVRVCALKRQVQGLDAKYRVTSLYSPIFSKTIVIIYQPPIIQQQWTKQHQWISGVVCLEKQAMDPVEVPTTSQLRPCRIYVPAAET